MIVTTKIKNGVKVTIRRPETPKKENLIALYDHINYMLYKASQKGIDISEMYYTSEQVEELKKDPTNIFL